MTHSICRTSPFIMMLASLLAGCVATSTGSPGPSGTSPAVASSAVAGPAACAGPLAEYQAVINADQRTGNLNPSVYRRVTADLEGVRTTCAAGRAAEANSRLAAVKNRYGYR